MVVTYNISVADKNSDTIWNHYWGATSLGTMSVSFDRGTLLTNAERSNHAVVSRAHFSNLRSQVSGQTTWFSFADLDDPYKDDDPVWSCVMVSETSQKVEDTPQTRVD